MPRLSEITRFSEDFTKTVDEMHRKEEAEREAEHRRLEAEHRRTHVFESYEGAVEWMMQHPGETVEWHAQTLKYLDDEKLFESHEQEYDVSGVIPYNVVRKYTAHELLFGIRDAIERRGLDISEFKDKWGKLAYVHIH